MMNPAQPSTKRQQDWVTYIPILLIVGWWILDLRVHWDSVPEYNFGWIVVLLTAYLVWDRWADRPRTDTPLAFWKVGLLAFAGLPLVLAAELYKNAIGLTASSSMALSIGSALFISAILLHGQGVAAWRHHLFPLLFLFVAVPIPKIIWNPIVLGLQGFITGLNVETLNLVGIPAVQHANIIKLPNCMVGVDEACSGVRSLQSSVMAGLFIGYLMLKRPSLRIGLLIAAVAAAIFGNFLRSFYLSVTAHRHGLEGLENTHDTAGWSVLLFTALAVGLFAWLAARLEQRVQAAPAAAKPQEAQPASASPR